MKKFIRSFGFAFQGLKHCFKNEQNFRIHIVAAVLVIAAAIILKCSPSEWLVLIICISTMLVFELFNTALEKLCDLYSTDVDTRIKIIKDVSAGAVLVAAVSCAICGAIIFLPKIISLF